MGECERDTKGMSSIFKVIGSAVVLVRMFPILELIYEENTTRRSWNWHSYITQAERLKQPKSGQFPDELVKLEDTQIHYVVFQSY